MRDQNKISISNFRGLWTRDDMMPLGYGQDYQNVIPYGNGVRTRESVGNAFSLTSLGLSTVNDRIIRFWPYRPAAAPFTERYIVFAQNTTNTNGRFFDTGKGSPSTPILSIATATTASVVQLFDRMYISIPTSTEFVYVYDAALMTVARKIAGTAPTTAPAAAIGAAGRCEPGLHLVTVIFETNTGFLTKPSRTAGSSVSTQITVPAGTPSIINLTAIPTGTAGVVTKRHILFTKIIPHYDQNPENYRYFLAGTIADNVTTTFALNVYDSQLVTEMTYLYKNKEEVEAGISLGVHDGRLLVVGPRDDIYLVRVSNAGEAETFSATDGFIIVGKGDGGRNQNAKSFRGNIYVWKGRRTYGVQPNSGPPNTWTVFNVDIGKGAGPNGVAQIVDAPSGVNQEMLLVGSLDGLWPFDGTYPDKPLSWVIEPTWNRIISADFGSTMIVVDPISSRIFTLLDPDYTGPGGASRFLMCDFSDGLSPENVRWFDIVIAGEADGIPSSMVVEPTNSPGTETSKLTMCAFNPNVGGQGFRLLGMILDENDGTIDINSAALIWKVSVGNLKLEEDVIHTFIGYTIRCQGPSEFGLVVTGKDGDSLSVSNLVLPAGSTTYQMFRDMINFQSESIYSFKMTASGASDFRMRMYELFIYGKITWSQ